MTKRLWIASLTGLFVLLAGLGFAAVWAGRHEFAPMAARRATEALGRTVSVGSLRVTPGRWVTVELRGLRIENLPGGSRPAMAEVATAKAEVLATSLLWRPIVVRHLAVDGLDVLLEHAASDAKNWKFGDDTSPRPADRTRFPTFLELSLSGDIIVKTSSGTFLKTHLDKLTSRAADAAAPVELEAKGSYNGVPIVLNANLGSFAALRDGATPFPTDLRFASGGTTLRFQGTMTKPLDVDGANGRLTLEAPAAAALLRIASSTSEVDPSLRLAGTLVHEGPEWRLTEATGAFNGGALTAGTLRLVEGPRGKPDSVSADLAFDQLDLDAVPSSGAKRGGSADMPLAVDRAPGVLLDAKLTARRVLYGGYRATDLRLAAAMRPSRVTVDELSLDYAGGHIVAKGDIAALGSGGRIQAEVDLTGLDTQLARQILGIGAIPLSGVIASRVVVDGSGETLSRAARAGRVSAVASMGGGSVSRRIVQLASTDLRGLLGPASSGMVPLSCLVGVVDIRGGVGTLSPLRVRAAEGTISGNGTFDLNRRTLNLVVASDARTTGVFALDIPLRVSGSFATPSISPARLTGKGRALLSQGDDAGRLLPGLREFAQRSACFGRR